MEPPLLSISPNRAASSEDFPEPIGPTTATRDPTFTATLIPRRTGSPWRIQEKQPSCITTLSPSAGKPDMSDSSSATGPGHHCAEDNWTHFRVLKTFSLNILLDLKTKTSPMVFISKHFLPL